MQANLGLLEYQLLQLFAAHGDQNRRLHSLGVCSLQPLGGERHLSEYRPGLDDGLGKLPPVRDRVNPHPPPLEDEELLAGVIRGVEDLACLEVVVRIPTSQLLQLLIRERLQDVHAAKQLYFFLDRHRHAVYLLALSRLCGRYPSEKVTLRGRLVVLTAAAPVRSRA